MTAVKENLDNITEKIKLVTEQANRHANEVKIIAVTKYVSIDKAKEAIDAGIVHLGENRDEGFIAKYHSIGKDAHWHFIGSLQTRKVKNVVAFVDYIHSLDRLSLAEEIEKRADRIIQCFVQVNTSGEESKHGLQIEEVIPFIKQLEPLSKIKVIGLMTMAPNTDDETILRRSFATLRELKEEVQALGLEYAPCEELSMGMSNDYEIAIEEGATFIRIGTALVGNESSPEYN